MGQVYVYQAALLCEGCGEAERESLDAGGDGPEDPDDESTYDSDDYPKGPTEEGESDTPSHCDHCHVFLESDLTSEGVEYVRDAVQRARAAGRVESVALTEWAPFYCWIDGLEGDDDEESVGGDS